MVVNTSLVKTQFSVEEVELVKNGDFSSGLLHWTLNNTELFSVVPFKGDNDKNHKKYGDLVLEFRVGVEKPSGTYYGLLSQALYIPKARKVTLSFKYFDNSAGRRVSSIRVAIVGSKTGLNILTNWFTPGGYAYEVHELKYDITELADQNVTLLIELRVNHAGGWLGYDDFCYIDDVSIKYIPLLYELNLDVSPKVGEITVNGRRYSPEKLPLKVYALPSEEISISTVLFIEFGNNTRYRFSGWSNGGNSTTIIVKCGSNISLMAIFVKQYYLRMEVDPPGSGNTFPKSGWYDAGSRIEISATPSMDYSFYRWEGSGKGSYTGNASTYTIFVNEPITQKAIFRIPLEVSSPYGTLSGGGWYRKGETVKVSVSPTTVDHGNGTRHVFSGWYKDTNLLSSDPQTSLIIEKPGKIVAAWNTQYLVTASTPYGKVSGAGWYNKGATATLSVSPTYGESLFTGYMSTFVFDHWEENGKTILRTQTCNIIVEKPIYIRAVYIKEVNFPTLVAVILLTIQLFAIAILTKRNVPIFLLTRLVWSASLKKIFIVSCFIMLLIDGIILMEPFSGEFLVISFNMNINPLSIEIFSLNAINVAISTTFIQQKRRIEKRKCPYCGKPATWIPQYQRWYCYNCQRYADVMDLDEMIEKVDKFITELENV
jgi:endogenous inhibitor of DNA gyrase (YacG/DUF329 family)